MPDETSEHRLKGQEAVVRFPKRLRDPVNRNSIQTTGDGRGREGRVGGSEPDYMKPPGFSGFSALTAILAAYQKAVYQAGATKFPMLI